MQLLIPVLVLAVLLFGPSVWVKRVLARYSKPPNRYPGTGAELARHLLDLNRLQAVTVEETDSGDHYDPKAKAVRLSPQNFSGCSLTAITVAAHEVGHAVQDRDGYRPLRLRTNLVRAIEPLQRFGAAILMMSPFVGALTRAPILSLIMIGGGMLTLLASTAVHFVTLPTELDASFGRALPMLDKHGILKDVDRPHAKRLLRAAAMTYMAVSLMSILNIARWWAILRR